MAGNNRQRRKRLAFHDDKINNDLLRRVANNFRNDITVSITFNNVKNLLSFLCMLLHSYAKFRFRWQKALTI